MNVLVYDVAASESGALNVLCDFYQEVKDTKIPGIHWYFVVSTPELKESENISVLRFPEIKKGWSHRIRFEMFQIRKLLKKYNIEHILSLQNIKIMGTKIPQTVYMHNIIPFSEYRFGFKENKLLWIYQNVIAKLIFYSMKKAESSIVQAEWIKQLCCKKLHIEESRITAIKPLIQVENPIQYNYNKESGSCFFYPAMAFDYKNYDVILDACELLLKQNINDFQVVLTMKPEENELTKSMYQKVQERKLPVQFVGKLPREEVLLKYSESVLLFASKIESSPLPLSEARLCNDLILAADYSYAKELLYDYENAYYFDATNPQSLTNLMKKSIQQEFSLVKPTALKENKLTILSYLTKRIEEVH